jgi:ferric-dicitrate binding protein FerR (iron transport regulator)
MSTEPNDASGGPPDILEHERMTLSLLQRAGRRLTPPVAASNRVYTATLNVWSGEVSRRRRIARRLAIAASLAALAICGGLLYWELQLTAVNVANVTRLVSNATVIRGDKAETVTDDFQLKTGDRIDVPAGSALGAQRPDGLSVRVSGPALLEWDSPERIRLDRGRMYVDMGPHRDSDSGTFEVRTPFARIEHVGTRFVADANAQRVRVAVRDGHVRVTSANGDALGLEGGQAAEAVSNGKLNWVTPPTRTDWAWVESLAPPCGIDGRSLFDVLTDLAREADLELVFASPEIERRARELTLHGPALSLPPRTAIDAVLATTDLDADLSGQRVVLRDRMPGA